MKVLTVILAVLMLGGVACGSSDDSGSGDDAGEESSSPDPEPQDQDEIDAQSEDGDSALNAAREVCADFADELDPDVFPTAAFATAADALGELDADDPAVADLAEAMDEAATTSAALLDAAAGAVGVDPGAVVVLTTDSDVFAYPSAEGISAMQSVPGGADLSEAALQAEDDLRQAAEAAGLDDCAARAAPPSD